MHLWHTQKLYLFSAASQRPECGDYEMLSIHASMLASHFYTNLYISFNPEDIFTKFGENLFMAMKAYL